MADKKGVGFFDFTSKVLSLPYTGTTLINPFPVDLHHLLATFFQLNYMICVVPYRYVYNVSSSQYEIRSNIFQNIICFVTWSMSIGIFLIAMATSVGQVAERNPVYVLNIFGNLGHLIAIASFIYTILQSKDRIKDLLNLFVMHSASQSCPSSVAFVEVTNQPLPYPAFYKDSNRKVVDAEPSSSSSEPNLGLWGKLGNRFKIFFSFRKLAILCWCIGLVFGIRAARVIDKWILEGIVPYTDRENSFLYTTLNATFPSIETYISHAQFPLNYFLESALILLLIFESMRRFQAAFIALLGIITTLTAMFIASHFTSSLECSKDYWKPSSSNVLHSFIIIRQAYQMINKIFGWFLCYSLVGEFPNLTFFVVNYYLTPGMEIQWSYRLAFVGQVVILSLGTRSSQIISKVKDWLQGEEKRHWTTGKKGSLQRRIILYELSMDMYGLTAHGFFQLSLPVLVSIFSGILSNALIIIQLRLSS